MVVHLLDEKLEIKRDGLAKDEIIFLVNELDWRYEKGLLDYDVTTSLYKVYGKERDLYYLY